MSGEKIIGRCFCIAVLGFILGRACGHLAIQALDLDTNIASAATPKVAVYTDVLSAWLVDDSHLSLPDGYAYLSSKYQYMTFDDANLGTIISDARMYVEDYYGITSRLDEIPVVLSLNETAITSGSSYAAGRVLDDCDTEEVDLIVLYLGDIMALEEYPKHAVFWVMVHEYVHCARYVSGECDDEEAEEEGETALITAMIVKDVIGEDSDVGWYVDNYGTSQYTEWAEEAALRQGVEVPWD